MPVNESSAVDAGQALSTADNVRKRARKLQQTPWWLNGLIILVMVGTAFLHPPVGPWAQLAAALVLTAIAMWRLRRSTYRPRYYDNSLWLITMIYLMGVCTSLVIPAVADRRLPDSAGEALALLVAIAIVGLGFGIAFLLTRLAQWRAR